MAVDSGDQQYWLDSAREWLKDTATPYLWTDRILAGCLNTAVSEYSALFPIRGLVTFDTSSANSYSLSGTTVYEVIDVYRVALNGVRLAQDDEAEIHSGAYGDNIYSQAWSYNRWTSLLTLRKYPTGAEIGSAKLGIWYTAAHQRWLVDNIPDPNTTSIPRYDWPLFLLMIVRDAWREAQLQGLRTPTDLDPGRAVASFDTRIAEYLVHRQSAAEMSRLSR